MSHKKLFNKIELEIEKEIITSFELSHFSVGRVHFGGDVIICMVQFKDETSLKSNWKEFNSYLTAKFIPTIKDEYSKWNFYIFFFSKVMVAKSLKYEIENNKFSSRKIVIEKCESITEEIIKTSISEHITNDNIQLNVESTNISKFKKDVSLAKIIDKLSLNKKNDDDLQNALNLIENTYKDEV